jgi:hypothetical protein
MCLLHTHNADTEFTYDDIEDFYLYNSDGLGIMYAEDGELVVKKFLPKSAQAAYQVYLDHAYGRDCVIHWRMKTHGDIDIMNCHPHRVLDNVYMAHNGVLSTGNAKDTRLSDTIHYINDYILPIVKDNPDVIFEEAFQRVIGAHIGSGNKFIFLDDMGRMSIINQHQFVKYKGCLLSNTYAWSSEKGGYGYKSSRGFPVSQNWSNYLDSRYGFDDEYDDEAFAVPETKETTGAVPVDALYRDANEAAQDLFSTLMSCGYDDAYAALAFRDATQAFEWVGTDVWCLMLSNIEHDWFSDDQIIEMIQRPNLIETYVVDEFNYSATEEKAA